jgi:putative transposase
MHSFTSCLIHCVWSTKNREPWLTGDLRERLWPYLGGIARQNQIKTLAIGGVADHVHILLSLPATLSIAKATQLLKGNSSKWIRETFPKMRSFAWQEGYGAFSVGISGVDATVNYIRNQTEHHQRRSFRAEFIAMLQFEALCRPWRDSILSESSYPALKTLG